MTTTLFLSEVTEGVLPPEGDMPMVHATAFASTVTQLNRAQVLERSQTWIDERVPYSQTKWHENRFGSYRQDCSGFVSLCWALGTSYTTASIMQVADRIEWGALSPGDALWRRSATEGHIALFVGWADGGHTQPIVHEEYDFGHSCERRVWNASYARKFGPIRGRNVEPAAPPRPGAAVYRTWGAGVRVRSGPTTASAVVGTLPGPTTVTVSCQVHGQKITAEHLTNDGWAYLPDHGGYISNIYVDDPAYWLPNVPTCG